MRTQIEALVSKWKTGPLYHTADFLTARLELEAILNVPEAVPTPAEAEPEPEAEEPAKKHARRHA